MLAASVFSTTAVQTSQTLAAKNVDWREPGFLDFDHVVVVAPSPGEVVGLVRLVSRRLFRREQSFSMVGITSVCIAPSHRAKGLSRDLMAASLRQARILGHDVVALIARRAVDRFYPKFDFWSLSSHNRIEIALHGRPRSRRISVRPLEPADLSKAKVLRELAYADCFGRLDRSETLWQFLFAKWQRLGLRVLALTCGGEFVGYAIGDKDSFVEFAANPGVDAIDVIDALTPETASLRISLPMGHPFIRSFDDLEVTMASRHCAHGGYIVRILDVDKVRAQLLERVEARARSIRLPRLTETMSGFALSYDGSRARVGGANLREGELGLRGTAFLLGARLPIDAETGILAPAIPFDLAVPDHF